MKTLKSVLVIAILLLAPIMVQAQEIIDAIKQNDLNRVKAIIQDEQQTINCKDNRNCTPLHYAADKGNSEIASLLISNGASLLARDVDGDTPLHWAAYKGNTEIARLLLEEGAESSVRNTNGDTPLNYAINGGFTETINLLLDKGAEYDATGVKALNVFQVSVQNGLGRLFKIAVEKGGKTLFSDELKNREIMHDAINSGSVEIVKILVANNVQIEKNADIYGWTPLHYAANKGNLLMVEIILQQGVDINWRSKSGETAYNIADAKGYKEVLSLIIKSGGNTEPQKFPDLKGPYLGQTPPGMIPEIFAPGIISIPEARFTSSTISPKGDEFYFYRWDGIKARILFSKLVDGRWIIPDTVSFTGGYKPMEPCIAYDNKKLYFIWDRPVLEGQPGYPAKGGYYMVERTLNGWSCPKYAGQGMFMSSSRDGQLYTTDMSSLNTDRKTYLAKITVTSGLFTSYERLSIKPYYGNQAHPCIALDGSYILFDVGGGNHLLVSFKKKDGTWSEAIDLVEHGFDSMAGAASISPDGKYLFFNCKRNLWWVDIKVIENLKPKE